MASSVTRRVGVVIFGLKGREETALRFLITRMNLVQPIFEFELLDKTFFSTVLRVGELDALVGSSRPVSRADVLSQVEDGIPAAMDVALADRTQHYGLPEGTSPHRYVVVTTGRFDDRYFSARSDGATVLAFGEWKRKMAPPSRVEFIVALLVREACISIDPDLRHAGHLPIRGCVFDFVRSLSDIRYRVLNGSLCRQCRDRVLAASDPEVVDWVGMLASMEWLKAESTPSTVTARLGHDLFVNKAIEPRPLQSARKSFREEWVKVVLGVLAAIVVTLLLLWIGAQSGTKI